MTNLEAEQTVLGALLIEPERLPEVMTLLRPEQFLRPINRGIYASMLDLFDRNVAVDIVTVLAEGVKRKLFERLDGAEYLKGLAESVPTTRNVMRYAEMVALEAKRSGAMEAVGELVDALDGRDIEAAQNIAGKIQTALSHSVKKDTWGAWDGFLEYYITLKQEPRYYTTGIRYLDKATRISPGDYVVVGGRPSTGKTALTLQIADHMAKEHKVVYFSLETSMPKVMRRLVALNSGVSMTELLDHTADLELVSKAGQLIRSRNLHIVEAAGWTVGEIKARSIQLGAEVIFIDYMSLLRGEGRGLYEQVTGLSKDLHILAQQTGMTVVALSQLRRTEKTGERPKQPTMQDLRESGQIEQDADVIILLHRAEQDDNDDRDIIVAKNKEGETGKFTLAFSGPGQRFYAKEDRY